jgi:hypothetical protein
MSRAAATTLRNAVVKPNPQHSDPTDGFAVVALVTEHLFRTAVDLLHQGRIGGDIVCLPGRNQNADWQALGVGARLYFGREAPSNRVPVLVLCLPFPRIGPPWPRDSSSGPLFLASLRGAGPWAILPLFDQSRWSDVTNEQPQPATRPTAGPVFMLKAVL